MGLSITEELGEAYNVSGDHLNAGGYDIKNKN